MKQAVAELYNAAWISVKSELRGEKMTYFSWVKVYVKILEGAKQHVHDDLSFNELVAEIEHVVDSHIVRNLPDSRDGLITVIEPILLDFRKEKKVKAEQQTTFESKLPPPSNKPLITSEQHT